MYREGLHGAGIVLVGYDYTMPLPIIKGMYA